jgi:tetratricopeptide (TPR) repeat protein
VANVDIPGFPEPVVRALQAVLERAMAERPDERFASAAQLADPLVRAQRAAEQGVTDPASVLGRSLRRQRGTGRQIAWGALLAIAALGGIALTLQRARIQPAASDVESTVAVESAQAGPGKPEERPPAVLLLPFENRTGDAAWDGLAHGATEAVGAGLRTVPGLRLVEAPVKGNSRSAGAIEKATWVVRASVQRVGNDLRLAAQLKSDTGAASGEPIEIGGELSSLSDRLRAAVIDEARLLVRHFDRQSRAEHGTRSLAARAKLLAYLSMIGPAPRREHFEIGLRLLDEAIAADPDYVPALVERGYLRALGAGGGQAEELIAAASADLDRAAAVDGDAPSVAVMRCRILQVAAQAAERPVDALIAHAIDACRSALQADPASAYVPIALARIYVRVCQNDEAMRLLEQSLDLDRSLSGRALELIVALALTHGQIQVADRMSERLLALYEEEQRLGLRALSRRAGAPPVQRAHFWRGAVLLRLGRFDEARARFDRELAVITAGQGDKIYEATAIRGLFRIAKEQGKPLPSELARRLAGIEAEFRAGTNTDPISAMLLCDPYSSVDPQVAVTCLRPMAAPVSCEDAIARAHIYLNAERRDMVRQMLLACVPTQAWERACIDGVQMLLGP